MNFNYPVDAAQFEKRVALALADKNGKSGTPLKFTVTYDAFKLNAWVHSQPLDLPRDDGSVLLKLDRGVRSSRGGDGTSDTQQASVRVPGLYSLAIQDISPTLVDNDEYEPEQVLVANVCGTVRGSDLAALTKDLGSAQVQAGIPRHKPPQNVECKNAGEPDDDPPKITSPLRGSTYALRLKQLGRERIAFIATTDADIHALYWFVNAACIGRSAPGVSLFWQPQNAGSYNVRVVDDHGRSDQRPLGISLLD